MRFLPGLLASETPFDSSAVAVKAILLSPDIVVRGGQAAHSAFSQALATKQADLDLGLVEPTAMLGRVMDREVSHSKAPSAFVMPACAFAISVKPCPQIRQA